MPRSNHMFFSWQLPLGPCATGTRSPVHTASLQAPGLTPVADDLLDVSGASHSNDGIHYMLRRLPTSSEFNTSGAGWPNQHRDSIPPEHLSYTDSPSLHHARNPSIQARYPITQDPPQAYNGGAHFTSAPTEMNYGHHLSPTADSPYAHVMASNIVRSLELPSSHIPTSGYPISPMNAPSVPVAPAMNMATSHPRPDRHAAILRLKQSQPQILVALLDEVGDRLSEESFATLQTLIDHASRWTNLKDRSASAAEISNYALDALNHRDLAPTTPTSGGQDGFLYDSLPYSPPNPPPVALIMSTDSINTIGLEEFSVPRTPHQSQTPASGGPYSPDVHNWRRSANQSSNTVGNHVEEAYGSTWDQQSTQMDSRLPAGFSGGYQLSLYSPPSHSLPPEQPTQMNLGSAGRVPGGYKPLPYLASPHLPPPSQTSYQRSRSRWASPKSQLECNPLPVVYP